MEKKRSNIKRETSVISLVHGFTSKLVDFIAPIS